MDGGSAGQARLFGAPSFAQGMDAGTGISLSSSNALPEIQLPKGGGEVRGMGEKFSSNLRTGNCSMSVPVARSRGRSRFSSQLNLSNDPGAENGSSRLGCNRCLPLITPKRVKGYSTSPATEMNWTFLSSSVLKTWNASSSVMPQARVRVSASNSRNTRTLGLRTKCSASHSWGAMRRTIGSCIHLSGAFRG